MTEWNEKVRALNTYIKPLTFPLAVKLVGKTEDFPERTRRPLKDLGFKTNICVGMTMARKYGWTVGITAEDNVCPIASFIYGWSDSEPAQEKRLTAFMQAMSYAANEDVAKAMLKAFGKFKLNRGQFAGIVFSPLEGGRVEPDLVMVFCNSAQLMRLVHGATRETGESISSVFGGRAGSCTEGVLQVLKTNEPKVVLPGNGDRVWAMVQDDEMLFAMPAGIVDQVIRGLEATHRTGIRYPIPVDVRHEPLFPAQARTP